MAESFQKCVAIIGAGVSGIVSAVNTHRVGIQPIVFDKAAGLGGMWNADLKPCWNSMRTNVSKFSTVFSDFPWPKEAPLFTRQRDVYQYLSNYVQQFLSDDIFRFNTQVTNISYSDNKWTVQYRTKSDHVSSEQFDFIIIASGFFDCPHIPNNITDLPSFPGTLMHSFDYRLPEQVRDKRVIIVGGSMSAAEIAADMATTAKQIIHVVPCSFWSVPRFVPANPTDPVSPFLPIDFIFYSRSKRTGKHEESLRTSDDYKKINNNFRSITGNSQKSSKLTGADDSKPHFFAISDMYGEWTRAAPPINERPDWIFSLTLNNGMTINTTCDDILILCTGYRPCFDFFSKDILDQLSYISDDLFCPILLHRTIFHPTLPNLAFVGMYRGPFWAIIELQSRWVAATFAGLLSTPSIPVQQLGLDMERRIRTQQPRPQFPHGDVVGLIKDLEKEVLSATSSNTTDIVIPPQYRTNAPDQSIVDEMNSIREDANQGRFVAGAVFRALHDSKWTFDRTLTGKPSDGNVHGQAHFHYSQSQELLYREQGQLILSSQKPLDITQKYLYVYDEQKDLLTVYFVDDQNKRGSLFHTIHFQPKQSSPIGWIAHGEHLCSQDYYSTSYLFIFNGTNLTQFEITYTVKGPAKDYVSKTVFRPE